MKPLQLVHAAFLAVLLAPALGIAAGQDNAFSTEELVLKEQHYLSTVLPGKPYSAASVLNAMKKSVDAVGGSMIIKGHAPIRTGAIISYCVQDLTFQYQPHTIYHHTINGVANEVSLLSVMPQLRGVLGDPKGTHWRDVLSVHQEGTTVFLRFNPDGFASKIAAGSVDTAARITRAIEYLRVTCSGKS